MEQKRFVGIVCATLSLLASGLSYPNELDQVPSKKATTLGLYLHPNQVYERMTGRDASKTLFIDVRTPQEAMFVGITDLVDANVPYQVLPEFHEWDESKNSLKLIPNSAFVGEVKRRLAAKNLGMEDVVILICRSGDRSAAAANLLGKAGFARVYTVPEGFEGDLNQDGRRLVNGWKNDGLPWSYKIAKEKIF